MKLTLFYLTLFATIAISCNDEKPKSVLNDLIKKDVPKFIDVLPSLSRDNVEQAFSQAKDALGYRKLDNPSSENTFEASSLENGKSSADGELVLMGLPDDTADHFTISLVTYPPVTIYDSLLHMVEPLLKNYKRRDLDGNPTWLVNGWVLQIRKKSGLIFVAVPISR